MCANESEKMNKSGKEQKLLEFFKIALELKKIKRTGWIDRKIKNPESIADHSYQLALMSLIFGKELRINMNRAVKMAIVHDLAESIVGDISVDQRHSYKNHTGIKPTITDNEKKILEDNAMKKITSLLNKNQAKEIMSLYKEYEERKTRTARIVKELDSLEVIFQALEYKRENQKNEGLEDFFLYRTTFNPIKTKELQKVLEIILKEKNKLARKKSK